MYLDDIISLAYRQKSVVLCFLKISMPTSFMQIILAYILSGRDPQSFEIDDEVQGEWNVANPTTKNNWKSFDFGKQIMSYL